MRANPVVKCCSWGLVRFKHGKIESGNKRLTFISTVSWQEGIYAVWWRQVAVRSCTLENAMGCGLGMEQKGVSDTGSRSDERSVSSRYCETCIVKSSTAMTPPMKQWPQAPWGESSGCFCSDSASESERNDRDGTIWVSVIWTYIALILTWYLTENAFLESDVACFLPEWPQKFLDSK